MTTLSISRKPKGIYGKPQRQAAEPQQPDKATAAQKQDSNQRIQKKPAVKRKSAKSRKKNIRRVERLVTLWPELFSLESPKPLKVRVFDDLIQDIAARGLTFGSGALRATLASYAQSPSYYRALMAGGARYDLKGQPCGEVTPQEQQNAETRLMVLNEKRQRRTAKGEKCQ